MFFVLFVIGESSKVYLKNHPALGAKNTSKAVFKTYLMDVSNKKKLLQTFTTLPNCPNCDQPTNFLSISRYGENKLAISPRLKALKDKGAVDVNHPPHVLLLDIKYFYCLNCVLSPEQVTQVKAFFDE